MKSLTCENVTAVLPLYIDGKVDNYKEIEEHLSHCPECFEKYLSLKNLAERIKSAFDNLDISDFSSERQFFKNNLSAYIDNELDKDDYLAFNAVVIKSPEAKEELEQMMRFDEKLKESIENNKKILNVDLSKNVINEIKKETPLYMYELYVKAAALTGVFIVLTALAGYFSIPENIQKAQHFGNTIFAQLW